MVVLLIEEGHVQNSGEVDHLPGGQVPAVPVPVFGVEPRHIFPKRRKGCGPLQRVLERTAASVPEIHHRVVRFVVDCPQGLKHIRIRIPGYGVITLGTVGETDAVVGIGGEHEQISGRREVDDSSTGLLTGSGFRHRREGVAVPVPDVQPGSLERHERGVLRREILGEVQHET